MSGGKRKSFGTVCCVPMCKNCTKLNRNVSFHVFPKDVNVKTEWVRRINRTGKDGKFSAWWPAPTNRICGAHFNESGKKKYEDKFPHIFPHQVHDCRDLPSKSHHNPGQVATTHNEAIDFPRQFCDDTPRVVIPNGTSNDGNDQSSFFADFELGASATIKTSITNRPTVHHRIGSSSSNIPTETRELLFDHTYTILELNDASIYNMRKNLDEIPECMEESVEVKEEPLFVSAGMDRDMGEVRIKQEPPDWTQSAGADPLDAGGEEVPTPPIEEVFVKVEAFESEPEEDVKFEQETQPDLDVLHEPGDGDPFLNMGDFLEVQTKVASGSEASAYGGPTMPDQPRHDPVSKVKGGEEASAVPPPPVIGDPSFAYLHLMRKQSSLCVPLVDVVVERAKALRCVSCYKVVEEVAGHDRGCRGESRQLCLACSSFSQQNCSFQFEDRLTNTLREDIHCSACDKVFKLKKTLIQHIKYECGQDLRCRNCGKVYSQKCNLDRHVKFECGKKLCCPTCGKSFKQMFGLNQHLKLECEKDLNCAKCGKLCTNLNSLARHVDLECGREMRCPTCGKVFKLKTTLNQHMRHECGRRLQCETCGKVYKQKCNLDKHVRFECGRELRCPNCDKVYKLKGSLDQHINYECGRELRCAVCSQVFKLKAHLDRHVKYECGKELRCPTCAKVFKQKRNYDQHVRHNCGKQWKCEACDRTFNQRRYWNQHVKRECGADLGCPICKKVFRWKKDMEKHVRDVCEKRPFAGGADQPSVEAVYGPS